MSENIKVAVLGACGKMGSEVVKAVTDADDMTLVGACDVANEGSIVSDVIPVAVDDVKITSDFQSMLRESRPEAVVDFAKPFNMDNIRLMLKSGISPVVGTTGIGEDELEEIDDLAVQAGVGAMVIPNFAIGAVLMMKFAADAAKYLPDVEIIELHHDKKADAPSGTAIKTAEMIEEARIESGSQRTEPVGPYTDPARGEKRNNVHVHSVRLPGMVAHQEVIFGGLGQHLAIRHDSIDRTSFMPGVLMAIRHVFDAKGLIYGLDKIL